MPKDLNPIRFPPLLVAVFATLTTQIPIPARGQTPETAGSEALHIPLKPATIPALQNQQSQQHPQGVAPHPASSLGVAQLFPGEDQQAPTPQFPPPTQAPQPTQRAPQIPLPLPEEDEDQEPVPQPPLPPQPSQPTPPPDEAAPQIPSPFPEGQPAPTPPAQPQPSAAPEPQVLVAEVVVSGAEGELQDEVYRAIRTQPGRVTTRSQLQEDINAIFATGFFSNVRAQPEDTPLGVRVTFIVEPNPVVRSVRLEGSRVLTQAEIDKIFSPQYGQILNFRRLQTGIRQVNQTYQSRGFVLGQVVSAPKTDPNGIVTLEVAEGVVEDIQIRFLNKEDEPTQGKTREFIITRELSLEPGEAFNRNEFQRDLQRVFGLGIFDDVQVALEPGQDPRRVVVVLNVKERRTGTFAFGAGLSSASGLFGTVSYQEQNLGGNNQRLGAEVQLATRGEFLFDVSFTDPWIAGDPYRTSYTVNLFNRLTRPFIFDGGNRDVNLFPETTDDDDDGTPDRDDEGNILFQEGDDPRVNRLGAGVTFSRPLSQGLLQGWTASVGLQYQRVSIRDGDLDIVRDACINPPSCTRTEQLSFSGTGQDDLTSLQAGIVRDLRDDPLRPTRGSLVRLTTQQYIPIGLGSILGNKLIGSYSYYIPVRFTNFNEGPQALAFNLQAGTAVGDLPPYEAFSLGGSNSVRGYGEGELGTGRSYTQFSAEYRFPLFSIVGGALFFDAATDLGTASSVLGQPAVVRDKPGSGFGYGIGVRVQTPLGPIRVDYGLNNEGDSRIHFGIGERF